MANAFTDTLKGMTMAPVQTVQNLATNTVQDSLRYYLELSVAFALLCTVVAGLLSTLGVKTAVDLQAPVTLLIYPVALFVGMIVSLAIMVLIFHGCARVVGGDGTITETLAAFSLSSTPAAVIGWIPVVGTIVADLWSVILMIVGVREYHHLTTARAAIAVLLPIAVLVILGLLAAAYLMIGSTSVQMIG